MLDIIQAHPGGLYLVFEFVTHDLKTFMDQHQRSEDISERIGLPLTTVRSFLRQIIAGVGCCHTYRILHRDLKPHNVSKMKQFGFVCELVMQYEFDGIFATCFWNETANTIEIWHAGTILAPHFSHYHNLHSFSS